MYIVDYSVTSALVNVAFVFVFVDCTVKSAFLIVNNTVAFVFVSIFLHRG